MPVGPAERSNLRLLAHQVRYEQLSFWRNPQSAVFTFIFPVVFVVIMGALFGGSGKSSYFGGRYGSGRLQLLRAGAVRVERSVSAR